MGCISSADQRRSSSVLFITVVALYATGAGAQNPDTDERGSLPVETMRGVDAVRAIDWNTLPAGSRIPTLMPENSSDDPLEAGFAVQWLKNASVDKMASKAVDIASARRQPNDAWAHRMVQVLRQLIKSEIPDGTHPRVFCNALGCLCYVERDQPTVIWPTVYTSLTGERGRQLGLMADDLDAVVRGVKPGQWELTVISRPSSAAIAAK
jgi:hypothetical protein